MSENYFRKAYISHLKSSTQIIWRISFGSQNVSEQQKRWYKHVSPCMRQELSDLRRKYRIENIQTSLDLRHEQASNTPQLCTPQNHSFGAYKEARNMGTQNIFVESSETKKVCTFEPLVLPEEPALTELDTNNNGQEVRVNTLHVYRSQTYVPQPLYLLSQLPLSKKSIAIELCFRSYKFSIIPNQRLDMILQDFLGIRK